MKIHNFKPGDLIRDKKSFEYGLVVRINDSEIMVCWQNVECNAWDTYPDMVEFVCHFVAAEVLDRLNDERFKESEKQWRETCEIMSRILEAVDKGK